MATNNFASGLASKDAVAPPAFWLGTLVPSGAVYGDYAANFAVEKSPGKVYQCMAFVADSEMIIGKKVIVVNTKPPSIIGVQL